MVVSLIEHGVPAIPHNRQTFRLVVVGSARTGKSSLVGRFLDADFEDRYIPTIENFYRPHHWRSRKLYKIKSEVYQLDIIDCSGNDPFPAARKLSYISGKCPFDLITLGLFISGDMFLLVSSVDNADSVAQMIEVIFLRPLMYRLIDIDWGAAGGEDTPCVFILNKADLPEHRWQTTENEVAELVEQATGTKDGFIVCSAATNLNIDKAFARLFTMNKCPKHMNPELHKMLRNELSADGETGRRHILRRMRSRFSREHDDMTT
ncbi:unnamed protein product [Haemonchus placei]|uniref:Ras-related and estrogen-regulated growth inhibitor n=1 Tax=Haemonchus placei TaxID=6290 RepID=A0A158QJN7_HAEPC|nr:unnamed protein product [Haemonchus placei]